MPKKWEEEPVRFVIRILLTRRYMDSTIRSLLQQVKLITKYYSQLSTQSGEGFNVFKVINMTHNETSVHSRFIAELLNPKGSHGQGNVFLKIFTELFCENLNLDYSTATTKIEKSIGPKDLETGGRLDIIVSDKKNHRNVIIVDKWSPIDAYELKTYPIKDTTSFAIAFQELGDTTIKYARDIYGDIYDNFKIGDTITVVLFSK